MNELFKRIIRKSKVMKSLKFRIFIIVLLVGIIPCTIMRLCIIRSYEKRAIGLKISDVPNQCKILCNHLEHEAYLHATSNEVINGELSQLSNLDDGRILVLDDNFRVIKDTYAISEHKIIISKEVIACFNGSSSMSYHDSRNNYIEITVPIVDSRTNDVIGIMAAS